MYPILIAAIVVYFLFMGRKLKKHEPLIGDSHAVTMKNHVMVLPKRRSKGHNGVYNVYTVDEVV